MLDSLRAWSGGRLPRGRASVERTIRAMDDAGVRLGLLCAWYGPAGALISNEEVAGLWSVTRIASPGWRQ